MKQKCSFTCRSLAGPAGGVLVGLLAAAAPARAQSPYVQPPSIVAAGPTTFMQGGSVALTAQPNLALAFSGNNQYVATNLDAQPSALPTTTWEAWVYPTRTAYSYRQTLLSIDDGGYDRGVIIESYSNSFGVFVGSGVWLPAPLDLNTWQHIAVEYKADGTVLFYKNGQQFTYSGTFVGTSPTGNKLNIGRNPGFDEEFQGQLDEVRIWSTARSTNEVQADRTTPPLPTAPGLVAAWRFNDNVGNGGNTAELTGNYPGSLSYSTMQGSPTFVTPGQANIVPSTYAWSPAASLNATGLATVTASPLSTTTYTVQVTDAGGNAASASQLVTVTPYPDLVVTSSQNAGPGPYNNVTVQSGGIATLSSDLTVYGAVLVQDGGTFDDGCYHLNGPGSFTLAAGGTLGICDAAGISGSGASGTVRLTGSRSYSPDASYAYHGVSAQVTGPGLPSQVRRLSTTNTAGHDLSLSQAVSVRQAMRLDASGNLNTNGYDLTLLSGSAGTATLYQATYTGSVQGPVTVQRYLDPSLNAGTGYRHYSAPVVGAYFAGLTAPGFTLVTNDDYNTSATPGRVTPFPNVFGYDQSRLASVSNNLSAFDKGWYSVTPGSSLSMGYGYTIHVAGGQVLSVRGTVLNGNAILSAYRNAGSTAADAGWNLLGNPFTTPIDYSQVVPGTDATNLDAAIYVSQSTGPYTGQYRAYTNGIGGNPIIPIGQGFFVRVSAGQTTGRLILDKRMQVTTADNTPVQRPTADPRPLVQLDLVGGGFADAFYAYAEAGATAAYDSQYDAAKLPNSSGLNLSSVAGATNLAIDGRPAFVAGTVLPLAVGVPAAGTYTLRATTLANLPTGLNAWLHDAQTGQAVRLSAGTSYSFTVTAAQATALLIGRFTVQFGAAAPLATSPGLSAASVSVYPNPAHGSFTVAVPAVTGAGTVQAELLNGLGQVVYSQQAALPAAGAQLSVAADGLAAGVYVLRLTAGPATLTKRLILN